ncbi:dual specificity tyrosine-phosphorylation-regulated kinase 1B isoform X2 [Silurus meridionalis]|nr:dual specificity tyrosine-phosphorylation-regulated kinase 1B isoform X2 [Silurus meridionalis]
MVITSSVEEKPQPSNRMVANLSTDTWIGNSDQSRYVPQSHLLQKPSKIHFLSYGRLASNGESYTLVTS